MARDEFSKPVITKLKERVANRCSNPDCRVPTCGPSDSNGINNIGVAAHITAASPGGPRYDPSLTKQERKSINNAIWLCANCSVYIDRDTNKFTLDLLKEWKKQAENTARIELGRKLPSNNEAIDTVAAALTGFPKTFISTAIANVHNATEKSLEALDPRFLVKTSRKDEKTIISLHAKKSVPLSITIAGDSSKDFANKYEQYLSHGEEISIDLSDVTVEGSKLIEELFNSKNGKLDISTNKIRATQKLWLVEDGTGLVETFDDVQGDISPGKESFTFNGNTFNGLFNINYQKNLDGRGGNKANVTMSLCLEKWKGINLKLLPYLEKLHSLYKKMATGWKLFTCLEINGSKVLASAGMKTDQLKHIQDTSNLLHYVNRAKIITEAFNLDIAFRTDISYTAEEHCRIAEIARILEGKEIYDKDDIKSNATCKLTIDKEGKDIEILKKANKSTDLKLVEKEADVIRIFNTVVNLPRKVITLEPVFPKIIDQTVDRIKPGDTISIEFLPQKDFKYSVTYQSVIGCDKARTASIELNEI